MEGANNLEPGSVLAQQVSIGQLVDVHSLIIFSKALDPQKGVTLRLIVGHVYFVDSSIRTSAQWRYHSELARYATGAKTPNRHPFAHT